MRRLGSMFGVVCGALSASLCAVAALAQSTPAHPVAAHKAAAKATRATAPKAVATPAPKPVTVAMLPRIHAVAPPPMWCVAYAPDGKTLAVGTYRHVLLYDATTGAKVGDYPIANDAVRTLAYSPDGKLLAVGTGIPSRSGSILLIDPATGKVQRAIRDHQDTIEELAWEGPSLLLSAASDETVGVNDSNTGKSVATLTEHIGRCLSVAVPLKTDADDGGDIFATGGADKAVKIWDAKLRRVVVNFDQSPGAIWCLTSLPHAGTFVAGCDDGKLRIFQVRADGQRRPNAPADEPDPRTGYMAREQSAHIGAIYAVAAAPDYSHIVSGGADGRVMIWNSDAGNREHVMTEAKRDIWGVAVSPDSKQVAAASLDGRTRIYDIRTGALLLTLDAKGVAPVMAPATEQPVYGPPAPAGSAPPAKPGAPAAAPSPASPTKKPPMPARVTMR